jgi:hypothetical protein
MRTILASHPTHGGPSQFKAEVVVAGAQAAAHHRVVAQALTFGRTGAGPAT